MSIRGNGRWLLWICSAGAVAALVTAVVSWKDIVVHYHLAQLRRDPVSLPAFLDGPDGAAKKLAAKLFAREPQGREAVVSLFLDYFERARAEPRQTRNSISFGPPLVDPGDSAAPLGTLGDVDRVPES